MPYIGGMDTNTQLPRQAVVLDYGYDPTLQPVIDALAEGLQTQVQQHMDISLVPPDAMLAVCYADARQHHMALQHQARGGVCLFFNHDILNAGNNLTRGDQIRSGRLNLHHIAPRYWPGTQPDADQTLAGHGIHLAPWKTEGDILLACPPKDDLIPFLEQWSEYINPQYPFRMDAWVQHVQTAAEAANLKLVWRTRDATEPLSEHLNQAALVATVQSAVGPQALAMGIPTLGVPDLCPIGTAKGCVNWQNPRRSGQVGSRASLLAEILDCQFPLDRLRDPASLQAILEHQHRQLELQAMGGMHGPEAGSSRAA